MTPAPYAEDHPFYPLYNLLVQFKQQHVQPPSVYYVTRDDVLQLTVAAPIVATTVQLSLRFMSAQGEVLPQFQTFTVGPTGGTPVVKTIQNAEGYLLSASITTGSAPLGQCFVSLAFRRGGGSADVTLGDILLQGYPGDVGGIAYPQKPLQSVMDGFGRIRVVVVPNPAAGADWSETVPAGVQWKLRSVTAKLVTTTGATQRTPVLHIADGSGNLMLASGNFAGQANAQTTLYSWFNGNNGAQTLIVINDGIPDAFRCLAGWTIGTLTDSIAGTDQWSNIVLCVEEFIGE